MDRESGPGPSLRELARHQTEQYRPVGTAPREVNPLPVGPILPLHEVELVGAGAVDRAGLATGRIQAVCRRDGEVIWDPPAGKGSARDLLAAVAAHWKLSHTPPA